MEARGGNADLVDASLQSIEAQRVIADFWQSNEDALRAAITAPGHLDILYDCYKSTYTHLTREQLAAELFAHERVFVEHMLSRLCTILKSAQEQHHFDQQSLIFNINTSLLYDVDETIGGILHRSDTRKFHIRPAAPFLFAYLRDNFSSLQLGIISTRPEEILQRQLTDENVPGSLTEIKPYINGEVKGIYGQGMHGAINAHAFDPGIYPDWQPVEDVRHVMGKMGYSEGVISDLIQNQLPILLRDGVEYEVCGFPYLWLDVNETLEKFYRDNKGVLPRCEGHEALKEYAKLIVLEILKLTRVIAEYIDTNGDADPGAFLDLHAQTIAQNPAFNLHPEHVIHFVPTVRFLLQQSFDSINEIETLVQRTEGVDFPADIVTKVAKLEYLGHKKVDFIVNQGPVSAICWYNYVPDNRLRQHVFDKGSSLLVENPDFVKAFNQEVSTIFDENRTLIKNFHAMLAEIFGVDPIVISMSLLQRIANSLRQLDAGAAHVVIAVDNARIAAKFDQLFQGTLMYKGTIVDPVVLFRLPEAYRGRIFLIHVSAEYHCDAMNERLLDVLKAA